MTMHLLGPQYTTNTTRKRKSKDITITAKFAQDFREYNKLMKKSGLREKSMDEYVAYRQGKTSTKTKSKKLSTTVSTTYRRQSPSIASYGDLVGTIPAKSEQKYTGTLVTGIATMHKSNAVPVINQQQAEDIARMRRG